MNILRRLTHRAPREVLDRLWGHIVQDDPTPGLRPLRGTNTPTAYPVEDTSPAFWDAAGLDVTSPADVSALRPRYVSLAQERAARGVVARDAAVGALQALEDAAVDSTSVFSQAEEYHRLAQTVRRAL